jgi:hypothetical protein
MATKNSFLLRVLRVLRGLLNEDTNMMKRVVLLSVALALALPGVARAQAKPDFSGSWKFTASTPANYPGSAGWAFRRR